MNVNDAKAPPVISDRLMMIFERQETLRLRYHVIEGVNDLGLGAMKTEFNLNDNRWQYLLKDYAWRVTEELTEATEVISHVTHQQEEAVDALHFLVEMYLIVGLTAREVFQEAGFILFDNKRVDMLDVMVSDSIVDVPTNMLRTTHLPLAAFRVVERLGQGMNCLKNKPWKRTQMETDVNRFTHNICHALRMWVQFAICLDMDDRSIYDMYFRKADVNRFRQRSGY